MLENDEKENGHKTDDGREVWRRYTLIENIVKVHVFEERMPLNLFRIGLSGAKSTSRIASQKLVSVSELGYKDRADNTTFCSIDTASRGIVMG